MTDAEWTDDSLALLQQRLAAPLPPRPVPCRCGCGGEAIRPARDKRFAETCYRRWLRLGRPDVVPPADPSNHGGRRKRDDDAPAEPDEARVAAWLTAEASRRVAAEASRAGAYLRVRGGRDALAPVRVRERVRDLEAFWALVGCKGMQAKAAVLLADLAGPQDDAEAVA